MLHNITIGQLVTSKTYQEKGRGVIVEVRPFAGMVQALVYFQINNESLMLPREDLLTIERPETKIVEEVFSPAEHFYLRLFVEQVKANRTQEGYKSASGFKIIPLPHQLLAVDFVLNRLKPRALIADEVGLGKTIEAALIYEELKARGMVNKVMVIAPAGLCRQWQCEMKQKFNEEFAIYDKETVLALKQLHGTETNIWALSDKIIVSMDFIKPRKAGKHLSENLLANREQHNKQIYSDSVSAGFDLVIFDEAHKLSKDESGEETARYKLGSAMAEAVPYLLLLTATPHQGDQGRFKNLLGLVDPHLFLKNEDLNPDNVRKVTVRNNKRAAVDFEGQRIFKKRITSLYEIERDPDRDGIEIELYNTVSSYVSEFYEMAKKFNDRTTMFLLIIYQRMVSSSSRAILKSLQKRHNKLKQLQKQLIEMKENDYKASEKDEADLDNLEDTAAEEQLIFLENITGYTGQGLDINSLELELNELEKCLCLARKAVVGRNDLKFIKLLEITDELKVRENDPNLKFIIFTEFVETQSYLCDCFINLGYDVALINGSMSSEGKERQKQLFKEKAQFLISTDAGGEGINLQFCRIMINYDLPWNPMRLEQRIGRIDRIGQQHDVKVINFQLKETVEQRVRDVIEAKLERIKREFNDGEDKLADILSTLQEEFDFEKIYIDAVRKLEESSQALEKVAQNIYERAKAIIEQDEMVLPFNELSESQLVPKKELEKTQREAQKMLSLFLKFNNIQLKVYQGKKDVFYFDDPLTGKRFSNVFFKQDFVLDYDSGHLMSFTHPYMSSVVKYLEDELSESNTGKLKVSEAKFAPLKGYLFIYKLVITNNIDLQREVIIPCFVDAGCSVNQRVSRYFENVESLKAEELIQSKIEICSKDAFEHANNWVNDKAESYFLEYQNELHQRLQDRNDQMEKYYQDRQISINDIGIDNIRESKLAELKNEQKVVEEELTRRKLLVPYLDCLQIAYMEFVE